jgi:urease accessory protein
MLIFRTVGGDASRLVGEIALAFEWRQKSRMRATLSAGERAGEAVGFDLIRGTVLRDGDLIATEGGETLRVRAAPEELIHITASGSTALARIAYHLGNRHVPVQVGEGWLRLQYDHVLEGMVRGLGGEINLVDDKFDPEGGAYSGARHSHVHGEATHQHPHHGHGHGHHHHDDEGGHEAVELAGRHADARHAPRIHDFLTDPLKR